MRKELLVGIHPGPHRAGPQAGLFGAATQPADRRGQALAGPHGGCRRAGHQRPGGHDQGQHQHRAQPQAQVGHDGVVGRRGGVVGQHRGRDGVQVDGPEHRQRQGQHQHAYRDPDGGTGQGPSVVHGHSDPDPEQHDGNDRQPHPERVEQVERGLCAGEVLDVEQDEGGVDLRDPGGQAEPGGDHPLLDRLDEGGQVDADGVALHRDRPVALAGQGLDQRLVGDPVGLRPGISERLTLDDLADLGTDKALDATGLRPGEPAKPVGHLGADPLLGQRVDRLVGQALDIQIGEDLGGDLVGDGGLDGRVSGQRGHRADIPVGVGDLVAGPDRHPGQRRQHTPDHDQQDSDDCAPTLPWHRTGAGHPAFVAGQAGALIHDVSPSPGQRCIGITRNG
jgi:hypothetical protein